MTSIHHRVHLHRRNARRLGLAFWANMVCAALWILMLPVTLATGLKASVPFVAAISIYALFLGHFTGALAAIAGKSANETAVTVSAPDEPPGP